MNLCENQALVCPGQYSVLLVSRAKIYVGKLTGGRYRPKDSKFSDKLLVEFRQPRHCVTQNRAASGNSSLNPYGPTRCSGAEKKELVEIQPVFGPVMIVKASYSALQAAFFNLVKRVAADHGIYTSFPRSFVQLHVYHLQSRRQQDPVSACRFSRLSGVAYSCTGARSRRPYDGIIEAP
ncbi:hypothetical protein K438DRAFT_1749413 [Mycena galopus ATCC 62051]|nr:hypothetical protein K438DRAFT_1749413 [Mycena galopus ATCC 62051]